MAKGNKSGKGVDGGTAASKDRVQLGVYENEQNRTEQNKDRGEARRTGGCELCADAEQRRDGMDEDGGSVEAASQAKKAGR